MKKIVIIIATMFGLSLALVGTLAFTTLEPVALLSDLTGIPQQEIQEMKDSGIRWGQIAFKQGVSEEFRNTMLENRKLVIEAKVKDGTLTQEQANEILARMDENRLNCLGDPNANEGFGGMKGMFGQNRRNLQKTRASDGN